MVIHTKEDVCQRCISLCHTYDLPRQNEIDILVSVFFFTVKSYMLCVLL